MYTYVEHLDVTLFDFLRICVPVTVPTLNKRHVGIARLKSNVNLGSHAEEIRFFILVLCPSDVKVTKTSLETARTFGTLFSDLSLRHNLMTSNTVSEFKSHILVTSNEFANHQGNFINYVDKIFWTFDPPNLTLFGILDFPLIVDLFKEE